MYADYSDPAFPLPPKAQQRVEEVPFYRLNDRIRELEERIEREESILKGLVPFYPQKQFDEFGFHSDYVPIVKGLPSEPLWEIDIDAGVSNRRILGIVLVPAMDQRASDVEGYAFPKRFRISSLEPNGKLGKVYVDWTEQDFPDPGMRPVVFQFPSQLDLNPASISKNGIRIEVFAGEEDEMEFFALARVLLVRTSMIHWPRKIGVSSSYESSPYWSAKYLSSSKLTLGMPLAEKDGDNGDLRLELPQAKLEEPIVLRVDFDGNAQLGQINIFPAEAPGGIDIPGYGFPKTMHVYRVENAMNQQGFVRRRLGEDHLSSYPGSSLLRLLGMGKDSLALEIECNDFPVYQGVPVFSLGEIQVMWRGENMTEGRAVSIVSGGDGITQDLSGLVDGKVNGRGILPLTEWIEQLAEAKPHEAQLELLKGELEILQRRQAKVVRTGVIGVCGLAGLSVAVIFMYMAWSKKSAQERLRKQLTADLHDDVGSSLGSISLIAEQLHEGRGSDEMRDEDLHDLALLSREAWASLREIVWVSGDGSIPLSELLDKLSDRAERVLGHACLHVTTNIDDPNYSTTQVFKRQLTMCFKEVVHNCARHAQARNVWLEMKTEGRTLVICLRDDGVGFDENRASMGIGIGSIKRRVEEMEGEVEIQSKLGVGTTVSLKIPFKSLGNRKNHSYQTSN
ncbi:sensor histidine kinase [Rubritalea spongiae]|uniref:Oxygen sensor histidine kinase NreB n=1 Tax=Rubritalea spongiae TaxID=430797 RepID=A0ABW5E4A5_9BACT